MTFPSPSLFLTLPWPDIQPYFDTLEAQPLTPDTVETWLADWSRLAELLRERAARIRVATVQDTTDANAEAAFKDYLQNIFPHAQKGNHALTQKLLAYHAVTGLTPPGMELPLREMRVEAELFREANLPLQAAEQQNAIRFNKLVGAQTVTWDGEETTITQLSPRYMASDRATREQMWHTINAREQADRAPINELWAEVLGLRLKIAENTGFGEDYRAYRWQYLKRFSYTPADCRTFHAAIEQVAVPAAGRVYAKHRARLGVESLRPWDLDLYQQTYPIETDDLRPFDGETELLDRGSAIFHHVDPALAAYFDTMRAEGLIDFVNRKGKGPGAFCTGYEAIYRPFIFGNAVGQPADVNTLLHESGHAFHAFETFKLPYYFQRDAPMEFNEVASMAMELLSAPYLTHDFGGYYTPAQAARARLRHLEKNLLFWPYMAVVDAFQHWVYENPILAADAKNCDAAWSDLWDRFIPFVDFTGLEDAKTLGWHRKRHIHRSPFYYIEYGLAQLGATQVWGNALRDQAGAVAAYRSALALGGTAPLPELYRTAGAKFAFDVETVGAAVALTERVIGELEGKL
ncbi:MAG: M3 family oligoendopeptidase [Anaerolineales bacterium]|nr:M3 family oligoendopeptidase [Anaerolineales bacterium]